MAIVPAGQKIRLKLNALVKFLLKAKKLVNAIAGAILKRNYKKRNMVLEEIIKGLDSLQIRILKDKFAAKVTEREMMALVAAKETIEFCNKDSHKVGDL